MNKTVLTGTQVKELLGQAVGGIYLGEFTYGVPTNIFREFSITEDGLKIDVNSNLDLNIPISEESEFINYAMAGEDEELQEEWEGSTYFDYKFEIAGYILYFNFSDKSTDITFEQFKELTNTGSFGSFQVESIDYGSVYINNSNCIINVDSTEIEFNSLGASTTIDKTVIDAIYNDSFEADGISFRIEFNNGMCDLVIEPNAIMKLLNHMRLLR